MSDEVTIEDPQALLAAYEKAKKDLVSLRGEKKALEVQLETTSEDEVSKWRTRALKGAAKSALEGTGVKDAERILKYINLEGVDFDDKDSLVGFDDKLTEVKTDFPELFDVKRRAGSSSADIHADSPAKTDPVRAAVRSALN